MNMQALEECTAAVRAICEDTHPVCAVVLGSGWSDAVADLPVTHAVSYADIPCLGAATVAGHQGQLLVTRSGKADVLFFLGRHHFYEGLGWEAIAFPVHLCMRMGIPAIMLTNAAGGIRPDLHPGDLMVIADHINAMGANPLIGAHTAAWGVRFPDLSQVYSSDLRRRLHACAQQCAMALSEGVYLATSGPTYETPAEIRAYAALGADAVGMSTVPEAILARAAGLQVVGLSCITNRAAGGGMAPLAHEEVMAVARQVRPRMRRLLLEFTANLAEA